MAWEHTTYHVNKSDIGHAPKAEKGEKYTTTFVSPFQKGVEKERKKNYSDKLKCYWKAFCGTRKRKKEFFCFLKC